jgi:hypothetical protein
MQTIGATKDKLINHQIIKEKSLITRKNTVS